MCVRSETQTSGFEWPAGLAEQRPWIAPHAHVPAINKEASERQALRPLVYVYSLPSIYNSRLLQYRVVKVGMQVLAAYSQHPGHCALAHSKSRKTMSGQAGQGKLRLPCSILANSSPETFAAANKNLG